MVVKRDLSSRDARDWDDRPVSYDWKAALVFLATLVALTLIGRFLAFRIPALARMRELNREADQRKLARERFRKGVAASNRAGLLTNAVFYVAVLPFCLSLAPRPLWRDALDVVVVLGVYDFFYYLTHRFLFHGRALRKVHARHHEARTPTHADAFYVHPLETAIGLVLYLGTLPLLAAATGGPLGAFSMAVATLLFTQLNTINHAYVDLPGFPFRWLSRITWHHAAHHVDMSHGNYATLTMLYDRLFGSYEAPVRRAAP
jgi:sterol desaturase/sphingolipid hydroxylase (fatty acid hydroxylase superfamily)